MEISSRSQEHLPKFKLAPRTTTSHRLTNNHYKTSNNWNSYGNLPPAKTAKIESLTSLVKRIEKKTNYQDVKSIEVMKPKKIEMKQIIEKVLKENDKKIEV